MENNIYCRKDQITNELKEAINLTIKVIKKFGFENISIEAKTPKKESSETYDLVKDTINYTQSALNDLKLLAKISQKSHCREGVEINFSIQDIFDNSHIISVITVDLLTGIKKKLNYINKENKPENIAVIKFVLLQSLDEFISLLIEKTAGFFPLWLAPVQILILPISEKYLEQAHLVFKSLIKEGLRVEMDDSNSTIQSKIRRFETEKIPYSLIIGDKEIKTNSVSVRGRDGKELGLVRIEEFISKIYSEIN